MLEWRQVAEALVLVGDIEGREFTERQIDTWRDVIATRVNEVDEGELVEAVRAFYADPDHRGRLYPRDLVRHVEQSRRGSLWDQTPGSEQRMAAERQAWERAHGHVPQLPCKANCPPRDPDQLVGWPRHDTA